MKKKPVWKESLRLYKKNFGSLLLALLVQLVLRAIALSPLMFLADKQYAVVAYAAIPLYLLIVLPARQNFALALQEMLSGGSVFTTQLICPKQYGVKLWRGVKGMIRILLWSVVTIVSAVLLYAAFVGHWGLDVITLMRICSSVGGGDIVNGLLLIMGGIAASVLLILLGCAVHSGTRHAFALGDKKLLRGSRLRLTALWFSGLVLLVPFAAVVVYALGDYALTMLNALKNFTFPSSFALSAKQVGLLIAGAVVLLFPLLPIKSLLPAVYLHMVKEDRDAQA